MNTIETMGPELAAALNAAEERIQKAFAEQGRALREIRDQELWRAGGYIGFVEYCTKRWEWTARHAYRLIDAADVVDALRPIGQTAVPDNEAQARELAPLKGDVTEMAETWRVLREEHGTTLTAAHVRQAVDKKLGRSPSEPRQTPPPPASPPPSPPPAPPTPEAASVREIALEAWDHLAELVSPTRVDFEAALDAAIARRRD